MITMAEPDDFKDFESLPPELRIKRLREFEEKKKKEIQEAERMVEETVEEIKEETLRKEQLPIDQMKVFDGNMLRTGEEREMVKAKQYISDIKEEESTANEDAMLEEVLQKEHPEPLAEGTLQQYGQKIEELKNELYKIEDRAESGGSMYEDRQRAYEIHDQLESMNMEYRSTADAIQHTINVGDRVIDKIKGSYTNEPRRPEQ